MAAGPGTTVRVQASCAMSPMAAIRSILQTLIKEYAGKLEAQQHDLLCEADGKSEALLELVNDLLRLVETSASAGARGGA